MELPCKDCVSGYILPGDPRGTLMDDGAYFIAAQQTHISSSDKIAVVLLTDSFGLQLKNPKILADSFADRLGFDVFVPDLFDGYPAINERDLGPYIKDVPGQRRGLIGTLKWIVVLIRSLPGLFVNRPSVGLDRAVQFIERTKSKGYTKIGVVGYCYGGGVAIRITTRNSLVNAVVACHPGPVEISAIPRATAPLAILCSDDDEWLPPAKRDRAGVALREVSGVASKLVVFPGTTHGFATRPNLGVPKVKEGFEGAFEETCNWLKKYLV